MTKFISQRVEGAKWHGKQGELDLMRGPLREKVLSMRYSSTSMREKQSAMRETKRLMRENALLMRPLLFLGSEGG